MKEEREKKTPLCDSCVYCMKEEGICGVDAEPLENIDSTNCASYTKKAMTAEEFLAKAEAEAKEAGNKKVLRSVKLMQKMLKSRITGVWVRGMIEKELAKEETQKKLQDE